MTQAIERLSLINISTLAEGKRFFRDQSFDFLGGLPKPSTASDLLHPQNLKLQLFIEEKKAQLATSSDPGLLMPIKATSLLRFARVSWNVNDVLESCLCLLDIAIDSFEGESNLKAAMSAKDVKFARIGHAMGLAITDNLLPNGFNFPSESVSSPLSDLDKLKPLWAKLREMKKFEEYEETLASCMGRQYNAENPAKKTFFNKKLVGVTSGDCFDWLYFLSYILRGYARSHLS